jgi:hypothetical protein
MKYSLLPLLPLLTLAQEDPLCIAPGTCTPPDASLYPFASGRVNAVPLKQWGDSGGFCGSVSIKVLALSHGYYISQDLIRKAAGPGTPPGHGDDAEGYEILHSNIAGALDNLGLAYNSWDWENQPRPQGQDYLRYLKTNLQAGNGIVQFVICKGDRHNSYGTLLDPVPYDHIEPIFKMYSKNNDTAVQDDDVIVHGSDYSPDGAANFGYFRTLDSLLDDTRMEGNCLNAGDGYGKNEMYPCIYNDLTYGYAIEGLVNDRAGDVPVSVVLDNTEEPDVREDVPAEMITASLIIEGNDDSLYTVYRFDGAFPKSESDSYDDLATYKYTGVSNGKWVDPEGFISDGTVMWKVVAE